MRTSEINSSFLQKLEKRLGVSFENGETIAEVYQEKLRRFSNRRLKDPKEFRKVVEEVQLLHEYISKKIEYFESLS